MTMIGLYSGPFAPCAYIICVAVKRRKGYEFDEHGKIAAATHYSKDELDDFKAEDVDIGECFTRLVQYDYDFPGLASAFGWDKSNKGAGCACDETDGTIDCPCCDKTAREYIADAREFLDQVASDETVVDDPGYFPDL